MLEPSFLGCNTAADLGVQGESLGDSTRTHISPRLGPPSGALDEKTGPLPEGSKHDWFQASCKTTTENEGNHPPG